MPVKWIKVRSSRTGHTTEVPDRVAASYRRRGWLPVHELAEREQHETSTPTGVDGTSSDDDSKEIEQ